MTDPRADYYAWLRRQLGGVITADQFARSEALLDALGAEKAAAEIKPAGGLAGIVGQFDAPTPSAPSTGRKIGDKGIKLIHSFETCKLAPYKDPGSRNGLPITAGWGTTVDENGGPIPLGVSWTQEKADRLFRRDIASREKKLNDILGNIPTTQDQFDAMLSLGYNIGMDALAGSTVMRRHKAGDHEGAATAFGMWNKNDGQVLRGLVRRRSAEAELYRGRA